MLSELFKDLEPINAAGLREQIETQVTNAILNGVLKPGERLVESAIADRLRVSRGPVREALSALAREGLIVYVVRRGYFVVEYAPEDIEEIYSLRLLLEVGALRRAIDRFTHSDIQRMQEIVDTLGMAVEEGWEQARISSLDLSFHEEICQNAAHSRLFSVWKRMRLQTWMLIGVTSQTHYDQPQNPKEFHQQILDAILEKDLARAEQLLSEHLIDAQERALRVLAATPETIE